MSVQQVRAKIVSSVWQSLAQSGVDLSTLPHEQQEKLVNRISDQMLGVFNQFLEEANNEVRMAEPEEDDSMSEKLLWKGRPFLSLVETYTVTTERLKIVKGLFGRDVENFELIRIQDIDFTQQLGERMLNLGDITIKGHDQSDSVVVLRNIEDPEKVYEVLRRAWLEARKRHGLQFREYM